MTKSFFDKTPALAPLAGDHGDVPVGAGQTVQVVPALGGRLFVSLVNTSSDTAALPVRFGLGYTPTASTGAPLWAGGSFEQFLNCAISVHNPGSVAVVMHYEGLGSGTSS